MGSIKEPKTLEAECVAYSIEPVAAELRRGNDELAEWAKNSAGLFLPVSGETTQQAFAQVAAHVAARVLAMKTGALEELLDGADPWLIAKA